LATAGIFLNRNYTNSKNLFGKMQQRAGEEVFESPDFEEEEDLLATDVKEVHASDDIISESLRPVISFQTFGGQVFDPEAEPIKSTVVYSSGTPANFESPLQKFKRLKQELTLFQSELEDMASEAPDNNDTIPSITKNIRNELTTLWSDLESRKAEQSGVFQETISPDSLSTDTLIKELQKFQASGGDAELADKEAGRATYSLFSGLKEGASLQALSERINRIEGVLGAPPDSGLSYENMTTAISFLVKHLQLLEQDKLEGVLRRVKDLNGELNNLDQSENKQQTEKILETKNQVDRVDKMFDMLKKWDVAAEDLPTLVERLRKLKDVHDAGAGMGDKINRLEEQQERIAKLLEEDKALLRKASDSLAENSRKMHENVMALDQRMKALMAKLL